MRREDTGRVALPRPSDAERAVQNARRRQYWPADCCRDGTAAGSADADGTLFGRNDCPPPWIGCSAAEGQAGNGTDLDDVVPADRNVQIACAVAGA
jgi:hypothetical protein